MIYNIDELIKHSVLGFYKRCEVIQISYYKNKHKNEKNIFTLIVFDEQEYTGKNEEYLSNSKNKIDKNFYFGIKKFYLTIEESLILFDKLNSKETENNSLDEYIFNSNPLKLVPFQFIPSNDNTQINNVLKNNFHGGSYIFEFFDEEKDFDFLLKNGEKFRKFANKIEDIIPIDLLTCNDCLGNYIFQLPVNILNIHPKKHEKIKLDFYWHPELKKKPNCLINIYSKINKTYLFNILEKYNKEDFQEIDVLNSNDKYYIKIWNSDLNLLLYELHGGFIEKFNIYMRTPIGKRVFYNDFEENKIEIKTNPRVTGDLDYITHKNNTLYKNNLKNLEKELKFKRYWQNSDALKDIKTLINKHGKCGVYILDPFLSAEDLLNTVLYLEHEDAPIHAITSLKYYDENIEKAKRNTKKIKEYEKILNENIAEKCGLNLEFRAQHGKYGNPFHDRFLIFPGDSKNNIKPVVFSLGTSINSFGKDMHVLQEVSHPQYILDDFKKLWENLKDNECKIWNSKD